MYKAKKSLNIANAFSFNKYQSQILSLIGFMILSFASISSHALAPNPGATCPADSFQGSFTNSDYNNLVTNRNNNTYFNVAGNASGNIPLQMKMVVTESSGNNVNRNFSVINNAINIERAFPNLNEYTDIRLDFRNSTTLKPIYLNNVAMSVFDVDYSDTYSAYFDDKVRITGITQSGSVIDGTLQTIAGSNLVYNQGLYTTSTFNCPAKDLGTACQGSIQFSEPVNTVIVRYTNTNRLYYNPTIQEIDLRLDSYCYAPPSQSYEISKTDNVTSISTNNTTTYTIKVTNTGGNALQNIILKDPVVSGLSKQSNITCDTSDTANVCSTPPTVTQLERSTGFTIPTLAAGKSYSIKVPTLVTAASGTDVTNTATISHTTLADKSSSDTNSVTSIFDGGSFNTPATCPSGHKMYYIGANPPSFSPINSQLLNWTSGNTSRTFTFEESAGNKTFLISFSGIRNLNSNNGTPPYFGSINGVTTSAINMQHVSAAVETNHILDISINRTISKSGYKIQDLDSTIASGQIPYIEQVDVSNSGGQLTFNDVFHTINSGRNIVTAIREKNCGVGECTIDATWGYNTANTPFSLKHNNSFTERRSPHTVGYSDFYFCLAPPQIIVNKLLDGSRVDGDDQFRIELRRTDNNAFVQAFTTTGSGDVVTDNTTTVTTLTEGVNYTVSEGIINGNLLDYQTTYTCSNATTGTNEVFSSGEMPVNAAGTRRTFAINNVSYGDEITCNVTNTPSQYTFSGIVFNDNGGITDAQADANNANINSGTYFNRPNYFNGVFNPPQESAITGSSVSLVNCATPSTVYGSQTVSSTGTFQISAPASIINANTNNICLIEERAGTDYPIRTTLATKTIAIQPNTLNYPNNNFGRVIAANRALVLTKYQYINDCNVAATDYPTYTTTDNPRTGFSKEPIENVEANECIAYKIVATNRANLIINNFVMTDVLQKKGVGNATATAVRVAPTFNATDYASDSVAIGNNGTVKTNALQLAARDKRDFYFNTKYDPLK